MAPYDPCITWVSVVHPLYNPSRLGFWSLVHLEVFWLVVSTPLKNICQNGNLHQVGLKIKNIRNHHLVFRSFLTRATLLFQLSQQCCGRHGPHQNDRRSLSKRSAWDPCMKQTTPFEAETGVVKVWETQGSWVRVWISKEITSWWLNQPLWTKLVKLDHYPK